MTDHECRTIETPGDPSNEQHARPAGVEILEQRMLVPNVNILTVRAPAIARKIQPGQFIILRADEFSERIPLTVADWDRQAGTVTCIFMQVGTSTQKLGAMQPGDRLPTFAGPLGHPLELENYGTVVLTGGCYGIGALYPTARRLKELGNTVIAMVEARGSFLLYWVEKYRQLADEVVISTFDGSRPGKKGEGPVHLAELLASGRHIDRIFALGCTFMMYETAKATQPFGVKTIVSLNPIMIDGTGMCGACRVVVGGETKFACVDGPDFDAHQIDWQLLLSRRKPYIETETASLENYR
jgi:ferredoxin/flavodoxin---NADP+ reductase